MLLTVEACPSAFFRDCEAKLLRYYENNRSGVVKFK